MPHMSGIIANVCDWFSSLGIMSSSFTVLQHVTGFPLRLNDILTCVCTTFGLSICPSIRGHQGCFHLLTVVNSAAMNIGVKLYRWDPAFFRLLYLFLFNHFFRWSTKESRLFQSIENIFIFLLLFLWFNFVF